MLKNATSLLLVALLLFACQPEGRLYAEHQALSPNVEWLKSDAREFEVNIENAEPAYDLGLTFRYANGYQFQVVKVSVTETAPDGTETVNTYDLKVREENGDYIGEAGYDIWDSEHPIESNKTYSEAGTYRYRIEHIMPADPLNVAMEIGVVLDLAGASN